MVRSSPRPPYSSGIVTPKSPSSFICSTSAVGNSSACSYSDATGIDLPLDALADGRDDLVLLGAARSRSRRAAPRAARGDVVDAASSERIASSSASTASAPSASAAFSRNFARTSSVDHRVLRAAALVRELGLEHVAVAQRDPHAARERRRVGRVLLRLVPHLRASVEHAPGRRSPRPSTSARPTWPWTSIAAVEYWRLNLRLVVACAARSSRSAGSSTSETPASGIGDDDVLDLVRVERRERPAVAPSEPWMKWQAGYGL